MTLFTRSSKEQETWNFISTVNLPIVVFSRRLIFYDQEHEKKSCSARKTSLKKCGSFDVPCRTRKTLRKDLSVAYALRKRMMNFSKKLMKNLRVNVNDYT